MNACPHDEQLTRLLADELPYPERGTLELHVERCPRCQQALETLTDDPLVRRPERANGPPDTTWRGKAGVPDPRGSSPGETPLPDCGPRGGLIDFLAPARAAGEIGRLGRYRLLGELGRGGMGVVYKARQAGLDRVVALKLIHGRAHAGPAEQARFRREAELVARLRHPNIVQIHDFGEADGQPYFSLEYVEGGTLAEKVGSMPQPPRAAAALVAVLARAVQHAHDHGIVHRDLKPANVLLTGDGVPRISDFGLAKQVLGTPGEPAEKLTESGALVGTPGYMSPEQAGAGPAAVGPATDVYGLGAILYALLTGRPPFDAATPLETILEVLNREPTPVRRLRTEVPRDLETVCLKCLRKEPRKRYASAAALANDLDHWLAGEPIQARPVSAAERTGLWARRNPAVAGLLMAVAVALVGGLAFSTYFGLDARSKESKALTALEQAREAEKAAEDAKDGAIAERNKARAARESADLRAAEQTFRLGLRQAEAGAIDRALFLMLQAWRDAPADAVAFRAVIRANLAGWSRQLPRLRLAFPVGKRVGLREDYALGDLEGRTIFTWSHEDGTLRRWDVATGQPLGPPFSTPGRPRVRFVSPDGRWLGIGDDHRPGSLLDRATGQAVSGVSWPDTGMSAGFRDLPDLFGFGDHGELVYWELPAGKPLPGRHGLGDDGWRMTRTADGRPVAVVFHAGGGRDRVEAIDLRTGKTGNLSLAGGPSPYISRDGRLALQVSSRGATWWDLGAGQPLGARWQPRRTGWLGLAGDGLELQCGAVDGRSRRYEVATGLQRGGDLLDGGIWVPDSRLAISLDGTDTVRVWDTSLGRLQATATATPQAAPRAPGHRADEPVAAVFSPDRSRVALTWNERDLGALLDARTGELLAPLRQPRIQHAAFSGDGRYLATATYQSRTPPAVVLRDGRTGKPIATPWPCPKLIWSLAVSPDGKTVAVGGPGGTWVLDVPGNTLRHHLPEATCIDGLLFHADSRRLAVRSQAGWEGVGAGMRVWDVWTGKPLSAFRPVRSGYAPRWSWEGGELVLHVEGEFILRRLSADGKEERGGPWPTGRVEAVTFSPDGRRMAARTSGVNVRQWDTRTGKPVGPTLIHQDDTRQSLYSSDNKLLAVMTGGNSVALWDAETGWPLGPPLAHASPPIEMAFTDGDRTLLTVTRAGAVHAWPVPRPVLDDPDRFETWLHARGGRRLAGEETEQLTLEQWRAARRALETRWPGADDALAELADDLSGWHRQQASHACETGNDHGELYHLTRLTALRPGEEASLHARVAAVHARVAARLPEGAARDQEWRLAWAAAKRGMGGRGEADRDHFRALEAVSRKSHDEAFWYLDRLVAGGGDWSVLADRAEAHARRGDPGRRDADLDRALALGGDRHRDFLLRVAETRARQDRWPQAARLLEQALRTGPLDAALLPRVALAHLRAGDQAAHARVCRAAWQDLPANAHPSAVLALAQASALSPRALADYAGPLARVEEALRLVKQAEGRAAGEQHREMLRELRRECLAAQAALLLRAGRPGAVGLLKEALKLTPGGEGGPAEWAWLALAAVEPVPGGEARRWLERARGGATRRDGEGLWEAVLVEVLAAEASRAIRTSEEP